MDAAVQSDVEPPNDFAGWVQELNLQPDGYEREDKGRLR
jgi:hypothetical protein